MILSLDAVHSNTLALSHSSGSLTTSDTVGDSDSLLEDVTLG